jgi:hypothetical protein
MTTGKCSAGGIFLAILLQGVVAGSGQAVAADPPSPEIVARLVTLLGADDFATRQRATEELVNLGGPVLPALRQAAMGNLQLEVKRRIQIAMSQIEDGLLKAEEKRWQDLQAPRPEIKARLDRILARTPELSDHQLSSAIYLLAVGRPPTDEEVKRVQQQFAGASSRPATVLELARSLVQGKEFSVEVATANSRLFKIQKDVAQEMDRTKKHLLVGGNAEGVQKIREVAGSLNNVMKTDAQVVELAFLLALSRLPTATESNQVTAYLKKERNRPAAIADIFWALMNSKEFLLGP